MKHLRLILVLIAYNPIFAQTGYEINGHIKGLPDHATIYLINGGKRKTIDYALVKNERFILQGRVDDAFHAYLYEGKLNKLADILLDNRKITVSGGKPVFDSITISGSDIDEQWKEWYKEDQQIGYRSYKINQVIASLAKANDAANTAILREIVDDLMKERIKLLKSSVKKYGHTPAGALLPNLCTIQDKCTKTDFWDMYQYLSLEIQKTYLGQEVLKLANKK
ncbi:MAG: DUF4369 domain-containing protein [Chitinophagaceae bacterium]|jgi:hypothetical protein|nr:DUF4369 domain-containing protein [Chitinophagaceae bacterium]MCA6439288.1 DUF4369 domain-containing protein [Chitinophagaceae bacterium]